MSNDLAFMSTPEFLSDVESNTRRWDDEWVAYWGRHKNYAFKYFVNLRSASRQDFDWEEQRVLKMTEREFYMFSAFKQYQLAIWVEGAKIPGSTIVELGCGPGLLGKVISHFCAGYIGLDYSQLALYLARLVSPKNCQYIHLSECERIAALESTVDICAGRFFFIHQNFTNTLWILRMFRYLLRDGGIVSADFYASAPDVKKPTVVLKPEDDLHDEHPSCVFEYSEGHIHEAARRCGFAVAAIDYEPQMQRRFVTFEKK